MPTEFSRLLDLLGSGNSFPVRNVVAILVCMFFYGIFIFRERDPSPSSRHRTRPHALSPDSILRGGGR